MTVFAATMGELAWLKAESAFGEVPVFAATDGIDATIQLTPDQAWTPVNSKKGAGSLEEEIQGPRSGKWSLSSRMRTTSLGVAPDIGPALEAGYGLETIVAATSVTYSITTTQTVGTIALGRQVGDTLWEFASGAWVEQIVLEFGAECMITMSGGFRYYGGVFGAPTVATATVATATVVMQAGSAGEVSLDSTIKAGADDNGGAGYTVTAVSTDGLTLTVSPVLAVGAGAADAVLPIIPAHTTAGTAIGGVDNGYKVGATQIGMISGKVTFDTGIKPLDQETNSDMAIGVFKDNRSINTESDVYFKHENASALTRAWSGDVHAIEMRGGPATANNSWLATMPAVRFGAVPPVNGEGDVAHAALAGPARKSVTAGDEHALALA